MRVLIVFVIATTACTTWVRAPPSALGASDTALVTTADDALLMRVYTSNDETLRGELLERWTFGPTSRRSIVTAASPSEIASANHWAPSTLETSHVEIPRAKITSAVVRRADRGRVYVGVGFVLLVTVLLFALGSQVGAGG